MIRKRDKFVKKFIVVEEIGSLWSECVCVNYCFSNAPPLVSRAWKTWPGCCVKEKAKIISLFCDFSVTTVCVRAHSRLQDSFGPSFSYAFLSPVTAVAPEEYYGFSAANPTDYYPSRVVGVRSWIWAYTVFRIFENDSSDFCIFLVFRVNGGHVTRGCVEWYSEFSPPESPT